MHGGTIAAWLMNLGFAGGTAELQDPTGGGMAAAQGRIDGMEAAQGRTAGMEAAQGRTVDMEAVQGR